MSLLTHPGLKPTVATKKWVGPGGGAEEVRMGRTRKGRRGRRKERSENVRYISFEHIFMIFKIRGEVFFSYPLLSWFIIVLVDV